MMKDARKPGDKPGSTWSMLSLSRCATFIEEKKDLTFLYCDRIYKHVLRSTARIEGGGAADFGLKKKFLIPKQQTSNLL